MRNDPNMNGHGRTACHAWRGNMDMQLILDHHAAVNYMVKYATKSEKAGNSFKHLYNDIIGTATEEDNPQSKLRSLMLRSIAGKRDLDQCEISRLLLSELLYHSTFNYVTLCTDLNNKQVNLDKNANDDDDAVKSSIIDFYANRYDNPRLQKELDDVNNLIDFVRKFTIKNNQLTARDNAESTVVITFPKVDSFHAWGQNMPWDKSSLHIITDYDNATTRWATFLQNAPNQCFSIHHGFISTTA